MSYQENQKEKDELLCSLVAVLRPNLWPEADRSGIMPQSSAGIAASIDSRLLKGTAAWPGKYAYSILKKEDGDPLLCVWLLVEQIVDGSMWPAAVMCDVHYEPSALSMEPG